MKVRKMKLGQLRQWLREGQGRTKHYDKDLLLFIAERAEEITLDNTEDDRYWLHLQMGKNIEEILWNEWDSFEGWSNVADVLWAELKKTRQLQSGKAGRKSTPASAS